MLIAATNDEEIRLPSAATMADAAEALAAEKRCAFREVDVPPTDGGVYYRVYEIETRTTKGSSTSFVVQSESPIGYLVPS